MIQSKDIYSVATAGSLVDMTLASVNHWVKRYQSEGLSGLYTKPGQGRKPLISAVGYLEERPFISRIAIRTLPLRPCLVHISRS